MRRAVASAIGLLLALCVPAVFVTAGAERPDTVFFEELTFDEIRAAIGAGTTNVIIATGGTEDAAPDVVVGAPTDRAIHEAERIARAMGHTFVAPVIAYAPGGLIAIPRENGYEQLIEAAAESVKGSGFKNVYLMGTSAASQQVLKVVAERLDTAWKSDGVRVFELSDKVDAAGRKPEPRSTSGASSLFIEDLTPTELRAAVARGNTVAIVPTGGTEKNGFHMAMGKHNFHVRAGAGLMAKKLGNALVTPVLQYVPEGRATEAAPGVLSCGRGCFEPVVASIARGVKALGFKEILLVGDNGGNQAGLRAAAALLNKEWEADGVKAYALTDFYDKGHEYQDAWFLAQYGWDAAVVGSHAGIKDTSQLLYVKPQDVRTNRIADSFNNARESGISGDPTKATAEFGRIGIEFKANGAIAQYRALKAGTEGDTRSRRTSSR